MLYYSLKAAEEHMAAEGRKTRVSLRSVASGSSRRKKAYGYRWRYIEWEDYEALRTSGKVPIYEGPSTGDDNNE